MAKRKVYHLTTTSTTHSRHGWTSPMHGLSNSFLTCSKMRTSWIRFGMKVFLITQPWIVKGLKGRLSEQIRSSLPRQDVSTASKRIILWPIKSARSSTKNNSFSRQRKIRWVRICHSPWSANRRLKLQLSKVWVSNTSSKWMRKWRNMTIRIRKFSRNSSRYMKSAWPNSSNNSYKSKRSILRITITNSLMLPVGEAARINYSNIPIPRIQQVSSQGISTLETCRSIRCQMSKTSTRIVKIDKMQNRSSLSNQYPVNLPKCSKKGNISKSKL